MKNKTFKINTVNYGYSLELYTENGSHYIFVYRNEEQLNAFVQTLLDADYTRVS